MSALSIKETELTTVSTTYRYLSWRVNKQLTEAANTGNASPQLAVLALPTPSLR